MLQPSFHIEADNIEAQDFHASRLLIVVDANSLSYVILNLESKQALCIKHFHFSQIKNRERDEILREIIYGDELLAKEMHETFLVYGFPETTLVPDVCFDEGLSNEFINLTDGNLERGLVMHEKVPWWDIYNVYRIPLDVQRLLSYKFSSAKQSHYSSLLLKSQKKFSAAELPENMQAIFFQERMVVSAYKKNQLQLIQSFEYADQMDVAYHLLNCCRRLDFDQNKLNLQISGFIENQSAIYHEMAKYFSFMSFETIGDSVSITDKLEQYPLHYFSSLLKIAACV